MSVWVLAVTSSPQLTDLPGSRVLQQLVDGAQAWGLVVALLGVFVGAGLWAVGTHSHNPGHAARGRVAALVSAGAALLIGGGPGLINFFSSLGAQVK
ncbi:MAG TPA: DUF6112 family protein [Solirubrobacteraceae bacterium]|nr:DUF6112 family protein [Solirubrobacteraceae bacterium]